MVKYAGICTDVRGVGHFWRKVPEMREGGWKRRRASQRSFGAPELSQRKRLNLGSAGGTVESDWAGSDLHPASPYRE
jgi:hypothetical protein